MFGPGRGRTLSLPDIPASSTGAATGSGSPLPDTLISRDQRSLSSRCVNSQGNTPDLEYGLGLLASASPMGEHGEVDDNLLDYDSDEYTMSQQLALGNPSAESAMDTGHHCLKNTTKPVSSNNNVILDPMYHQCRASRISAQRDSLVSISPDSTFGKRIVSQSTPVGSFEDHPGIEKTFHGSRILKGNCTVNQSLSSSFDPASLVCVSCKNEHVVVGTKPITVCFSDQNFVTSVPSKDGECVCVVRVENPSLLELLDLAKEIFANVRIPEGSIFLFGCISHLSRIGTSIYAKDWTTLVAGVAATWRGIHVCPLIPLVVSECTGSVTREICELSVWYSNVYDNDNKGLHETWSPLVEAMESSSIGSTRMEIMDSYKVALPSTLTSTSLDTCTTFCSNNSRPITFPGLSKDTCCELLSNLLACIFSNFRACSSPENLLVRTTDNSDCPQSETREQNVVLIGSSNLKYSTPYFNDTSFKYVDNLVPGWKPTPENIVALRDNVRAHVAQHASAFVFDLLGNSSVRFEQFDGSLSLPFKSQGKFHLGGKVVASPPDVFKKAISAIIPILLEKKDTVPPIPRYLFSRCCSDSGHCTNANDVDFRETMLTGFLQQRGELIKTLVAAGVTNFKVLDACCTTTCATTANTKTRLTDLKSVYAGDGVHFVAEGYQNLAARSLVCSLVCIRALLSAPPRSPKTVTSFWRGFRSPIGSHRVLSVPANANRGRGGGGAAL
jgi:hypothetical protein